MHLLYDWSPLYIFDSGWLNTAFTWQVSLHGNVRWRAECYQSASRLSYAVRHDVVPSEYMKAVSTAYYNAMEHIPSASFNPLTALSDIKSLASTKLHILEQRLGALKGASADYLQYRYGLQTTDMDLKDIQSLSDRLASILGQEMVCNGSATAADGTVVHVTLRYSQAATMDMLVFSSPLKRLIQRGMVDVWDAVPFSFIIDWFVDVEKYLTDVSNLLVNETWKPYEVWVSFSSSRPGVTYEYARVHGSPSFASTSLGYSDYVAQPNNRGIAYHIADGLAVATQLF